MRPCELVRSLGILIMITVSVWGLRCVGLYNAGVRASWRRNSRPPNHLWQNRCRRMNVALSLACTLGMALLKVPERLPGIWSSTLAIARGVEPWSVMRSSVVSPMSGMGCIDMYAVRYPACREELVA